MLGLRIEKINDIPQNMILVLATVAVFGAVAVLIFSMRQLAYQNQAILIQLK